MKDDITESSVAILRLLGPSLLQLGFSFLPFFVSRNTKEAKQKIEKIKKYIINIIVCNTARDNFLVAF
jgi:hypothetical protein